MPFRQVRHLLLTVCALSLACAAGFAQSDAADSEEPTADPKPTAPAPAKPRIREVKPETYYVLKDGKLVLALLNVPFEELAEALKTHRKVTTPGPPLPAYTLDDLSIVGTASNEKADLTAVFTIRLLRDGWVRVPLRLSDVVLLGAKYDGDGELFLMPEQEGGYTCYLRAPKENLYTLTLSLLAPVRQVGGEMRLALQAPRATTSEISLRVPLKEVTPTASNDLPVDAKDQGEETLLVVSGLDENFQLTWREGAVEPTDARPLLEVRSETLVEIVGERKANGDVRLHVNSVRDKFDSFNVRLPTGARLSDRQPSQSELQVTKAADDEETGASLVQIKLDQPTMGPVEAQLLMELAPAANGMGTGFEIGGLDVEDAFRQSGWIDFDVSANVANNLELTFEPGPDVQQTLVPDALGQKIDARFEFTRTPFSLRMQVSTTPRNTDVSIEPIYVLHVESGRVVLDATLKYRVRGAPPTSVSLNMPDWELIDISPETRVNDKIFDRERTEPLDIPLMPFGADEDDLFTLQIRAMQPIDTASDGVAVSLPRPEERMLTPAAVVVIPADNVELTVDEGDLERLERESFPPTIDDLPPRQQAPLYYRERSDAGTGAKPTVFAAGLRVRQRAVSVGNECELKVDLRSVRVEQHIRYGIVYEPLNSVPLVVPRSVLDAARLRISCDDEALPFFELKAGEGDSELSGDTKPARIQVDLLRDRIGPCDIVVHHDHSRSDLVSGQENAWQVPLVVPEASEDTTVTGSTLRIQPSEDAQVDVVDGGWEVAKEVTESVEGEQVLTSSVAAVSVSLRVNRSIPTRQMSTVVSRAWIQTWLDSRRRYQRAVFRVATNGDQIEVRLPDRAVVEDLGLDGRRLPVPEEDSESTVIALPEEPSPAEHVVELWYYLPREQEFISNVGLEAPIVEDAQGTTRWYWYLAMPPGEHLLNPPAGMTSEMTWQRQGFYWGRCPRLGQTDLERWTGATPQAPTPETLNHYLFSSFGRVSEPQCVTADRTAILLVASGVALMLGLALIYIPALRHPGLLFGVGVTLISAMLVYPGLAIGIAQASALGLVLIVGAFLLKRLVDYGQARRGLLGGASYSSPDSKTVKAPATPIDSQALRTTSAIPAPGHISAAESST